MTNRHSTSSLLGRLERTKNCPNYINAFKYQREQELEYIKNLPPVQKPFVRVVQGQKPTTSTRACYEKLMSNKHFLRNANFQWLESYDNFLQDMGPAPFENCTVKVIEKMTSYTKITCYWSKK